MPVSELQGSLIMSRAAREEMPLVDHRLDDSLFPEVLDQTVALQDSQHSLFSRSMRQSLDVMRVSVCLKASTEAKVPFDRTNSPLATESASPSSVIDFDPDFVRDNSEMATHGSSRVKGVAPGWRSSAIWLLRGSKARMAKLRPDAGTSDSSNSESEGATFDRLTSSSSMVSSCDADFEACREILEEATNESSTIKQDTSGERGSTGYLLRSSKRFLAKFRADGGIDSPNSEAVSEERQRQEVASKLQEDPTHAHEEGPKEDHLQLTVVRHDEFSIGRGQLEGQEEPDRHTRGSTRAIRGYIRIPKSIKRGVKQLRKSKPDKYRRKVVVNGIPINDVDVKKAEECAGPIHPGNYWYDIQAGFWGLEPGPCLGIIPPCIMELNTPMCKFCSGGNTGILVNGRELHEKDLERLSFRGLPTKPGTAYCITIDGRVMDENSRKYVTCLGMLAPSLKKYGRGSGIYMPAVY